MNKTNLKTALMAGTAKIDITTDKPATPVKDPLYAKALVIDDGNTKIVIVTMDVTAIGGRKISDNMLYDVSEDFLPELRKRLENELNIPGDNVLVNASHTHPPGRLLCDDDEQVNRVYKAVKSAFRNMVNVKIGFGSVSEERIIMNRTLRLKNGKQWSIRHTNPSPRTEDISNSGPLDSEVGIIRIDRLDGTPLAALYNYACHLLFADTQGSISANFPAYCSKLIEQTLGHDSMAFFLQGAAGDVIDVDFKNFNQSRNIEKLGNMLGETILKTYSDINTGQYELRHIKDNINVPWRTDIPEKVQRLREEEAELLSSLAGTTLNFESFISLYQSSCSIESEMDSLNKKNIDKYLHNIKAMEKLARIQDQIATLNKHQKIINESGEATFNMELQALKIGDCLIISSPAELLTEIGLDIKNSSPYKYTFVLGYTNGYVHYGAPARDYEKGGYEVTECLLAPEWQEIFEDKTKEIINRI